jgi:SAM-dependent methyltransferase
MSWLDVGCGKGDLLRMFADHFRAAAGCDPSRKMIDCHSGACVYEQPSPSDLPFPDRSFDFVTAACVFHHVHGHDRNLLMSSILRVLKPSGLFCLMEHNPWNPVTRIIVKRCPVDVDAELLRPGMAERLVRLAGLQVLETRHFLFCPESLEPYVGGIERALHALPFGGQYAVFCRKAAV